MEKKGGGRRSAPHFIVISLSGLPHPSHFIIFDFMLIGPIFISWQSGQAITQVSMFMVGKPRPKRSGIPLGIFPRFPEYFPWGRPRMNAPASLERDHHWVRLRLLGWVFIGLWQAALLAGEFVDLGLMTLGARIAGGVLGLVGLVLVAVGFERIVGEAHRRAGEDH